MKTEKNFKTLRKQSKPSTTGKGKVFPLVSIKVHPRCGVIPPLILNPDTRWK
jgi:hypothetical protein